MKNYTFISYRKEMNLPDGIYNGKYNSEPTIIRLRGGIPVFVQFIDTRIFHPNGVLHSSVELLLPAQEFVLSK